MTTPSATAPWPPDAPVVAVSADEQPREFERIWRGFMTARATLGLVLMMLQGSIFALITHQGGAALLICTAYFAAALAVRLTARPRLLGRTLDSMWLRTVGLDVLTFSSLQWVQAGAINYAPLLALPVLMVSILGTPLQAIASAAGVTLLLFVYAAWQSLQMPGDFAAYGLQAALTGAGCFAISFVASQMATRLANVERRARRSQLAATVQQQVNQLVIESLDDGILVAAEDGRVLLANPAAHALLDSPRDNDIDLAQRPRWGALLRLIHTSFLNQNAQIANIEVIQQGAARRRLLVRTQLAGAAEDDAPALCVVFMQDQRQIEARVRAEKLAGMGRMSAAVAHEIRNPLAAITQANALLSEDLQDPGQRRLAEMVRQNAARLENIVQDVLRLVQVPTGSRPVEKLDLTAAVERIAHDWSSQNGCAEVVTVCADTPSAVVLFDAEHLRRVLINLLDNALRYTSRRHGGIQIRLACSVAADTGRIAALRVWSDGATLDSSVEQHLFEPFFSSESRSSGLGLYICRELCESHGANISYERSEYPIDAQVVAGNEFIVTFKLNEVKAFSPNQYPA